MSPYVVGLLGAGGVFASRTLCHASRFAGVTLVGAGLLLAASPAFADDETLVAKDDGEVACTVSRQGLTRISLRGDRFASLSKLTREADPSDFSVVHEPTRGDIYISLPDGYAKPDVSFFGTTGKGFVYKFDCRVSGDGAHQVFIDNRDLVTGQKERAGRSSPGDTAIALVQAMYAGQPLAGYDLRQLELRSVSVGRLKVRLLTEYRGSDFSGRVLRIENRASEPVTLDETVIAPANAIAVSVTQPNLKPGQITTAYIVLPTGALP